MRRLLLLIFVCWLPIASMAQDSEAIRLANEYYRIGEFEKAKSEFKKLARNRKNISRIHDNYFKLLLAEEDFQEAEKYMKNVMKQVPTNFMYEVDMGVLLLAQNEQKKAEGFFSDLISKVARNAKENNRSNDVRMLAQTFFQKNLREVALQCYERGRAILERPQLFSLELANAYRLMNKKQPMVKEYLRFSKYQPQNLNYVKNSFQRILTEPEDLDTLEITPLRLHTI